MHLYLPKFKREGWWSLVKSLAWLLYQNKDLGGANLILQLQTYSQSVEHKSSME